MVLAMKILLNITSQNTAPPQILPSWMALEVVLFATLNRLFQSLKLDNRKEVHLLNNSVGRKWLY